MKREPLWIDLAQLPEQERFPFWRQIGSTIYRPLPSGCAAAGPLSVQARMHSLGAVTLSRMVATAQDYERTAAMLRADGCDHFLLLLLEQGTVVHATGDRELTVEAGDLLLLDAGEVGCSSWTRHGQLFAAIPRALLQQKGAVPLQTTLLCRRQPHAQVLAAHLRSLWQVVEEGSPGADGALALGLAALVRSYFRPDGLVGSLHDLGESGDGALSRSIRDWIESHLHRGDLGAEMLAAQFHLSRSSLYRLFQPWGGVRSYIRERRMQLALQVLRSQGGSPQFPLGQLASSLGFPSSSAFSHAFRRRWGVPPRLVQHEPGVAAHLPSSEPEPRHAERGRAWERLAGLCERYYRGIAIPG